MVTIVIVDAAVMRRAVRETLRHEVGLRVVGEAGSLRRALAVVERIQPDIILVDAEIADLDAPTAVRALRQRAPSSALIVVTIEPDRLARVVEHVGGTQVVSKVDGPAALLGAVRRAATHGRGPT